MDMRLWMCVAIATGLLIWPGRPDAREQALALRQEYNAVSAAIDSLVRQMQMVDAGVLDGPRLPEGRTQQIVPQGMSLVMIFWADDEAQVWLNDFPVGETRLTPVEVVAPDMYLRGQNQIRARCWDTDWVESGFLCGLYLKDGSGTLYPIVVSDGEWNTPEGKAIEIAYAHPLPDIPGAEVIWGPRTFGVVALSVDFDQGAVRDAAHKAAAGGLPEQTKSQAMDYHAFVQQLSVFQARREVLQEALSAGGDLVDIPVFEGASGRSVGLTLGKAGPLKEAVSAPVAEQVRAWSRDLPEAQQKLIYPDPRALKGEGAANLSDAAFTAEAMGQRQEAYTPPEERGASRPGTGEGARGRGVAGQSNVTGEGQEGAVAGGLGGGMGRASRWGLLLPTLIMGVYVVYVITNWQTVMGYEE